MSAEVYLRTLVQQVRHLLQCEAAALLLACPDPFLRHPLLNFLPLTQAILSPDAAFEQNLPDNVMVAALRDIAMQTGLTWSMDYCRIGSAAYSLLVAPIEGTRGTLGVLICFNSWEEPFFSGENALLLQHLPMFVQRVEMIAHEISSSTRSFTDAALATMHEQNKYVSMVSHELRAPLTAIKGYAGLLHAYGVADVQEGYAAKEMTVVRQQQYLTAIMEQVDHLEILIADLLDISRLQAGRLALHCSEINVSLLCQRILSSMQDRVDRQAPGQYCFHCTIEPDLPLAWADPDRMQQILVNLLENAVKYSPDGGVIEMFAYTLQQPGQKQVRSPLLCAAGKQTQVYDAEPAACPDVAPCMIGITIRDRGIGIPDPQQHELFQPFSRLQHPTSEQIAGTGLGLYISRRLVEAMNGHIALHSKPGEGTWVTFTVPSV